METDELVNAAEAAAKNARRLFIMCMLAVSVAVVVLMIDQSIKRSIISEAQQTRTLFDQVRAYLAQGVNSGQTAEPAGADSRTDHDADADVAGPAGTSADSNPPAGDSKPARGGRQVGAKRGPGGDG